MLEVTLLDGINNDKVDYIYGDAQIQDPCAYDEVSFDGLILEQSYTIKESPEPLPYAPIIN